MIKVGFLVSYDYELLKHSIPRVYDEAHSIALAKDKYQRTWGGNTFEIPESFFEWVKSIDTEGKISIYEDDFYVPGLSNRENDTRERNMLARFMGEGGWHVQVDSDEYFLDFRAFCDYLRSLDTEEHVTICPWFITTFKKLDNGYLFISGNKEYYPVATNYPYYDRVRTTLNNKTIYTDHLIIHDSWSRTEEDLWFKLNNWGHNIDFNVLAYFKLWKAVDKSNYRYINNYHPFTNLLWQDLTFVEGKDIEEMLGNLDDAYISGKYITPVQHAANQPLLPIVLEKIKKRIPNKIKRQPAQAFFTKGKSEKIIKVGMLLSDDYEQVKTSLPLLYPYADHITLAIDKDGHTLHGGQIDIPDEFYAWVEAMDTQNKIRIYKDSFYDPTHRSENNDTHARNMLARFMGEGGWHVQVDASEYFRDFGAFCNDLKRLKTNGPVTVHTLCANIFKKTERGFLYVSAVREDVPHATNHPFYTMSRSNAANTPIYTDHVTVQGSWACPENELRNKLLILSHRDAFDVEAYLKLWLAADEDNYIYFHDFHPLAPQRWKKLTYARCPNIVTLLSQLSAGKILEGYKSPIQEASEQSVWKIVREKVRRKLK